MTRPVLTALAAAAVFAASADAVTPISPRSCPKVTRRFGEATRIVQYGSGCSIARALASRAIRRATYGHLGPFTADGYRCRLRSSNEAQIVNGRCIKDYRYVTWRQFIANG